MKASAEMKVLGGKLVSCELETEGDTLVRLAFYGDFFLHPEEMIEMIEKELSSALPEELPKRTVEAFTDERLELAGVSPKDFGKVVEMALEKLRN